MKRLVVLGAFGVLGIAASCGGDEERFRRDRRAPDAGDGGAPSEGGEGGEIGGGVTGGRAGSGPGGAAGSGGAATGGRGAGGTGGSMSTGGSSGAGAGGTAGSVGGTGPVICGIYDCTRLPHVRPGAPVECRNGACFVPPDSCAQDYAHCSTNTSVGCEAHLGSSETCGDCLTRCSGDTPVCANDGSGWRCAGGCVEPRPNRCGGSCTDIQTDDMHCGACRVSCMDGNRPALCTDGECVPNGPCFAGFGDCDTAFGCETNLTAPENCGACGRNDCGAINATPDCSSLSGCVPPICESGFGNCDTASPSCEATYGAACFPRYAGTRLLALVPVDAAVGTDGSLVLVGTFSNGVDFDASPGVDLHVATSDQAYVTRFDASGNYARTVSFGGDHPDSAAAVAIAPDGSPVVAGFFFVETDVDPSAGVDSRSAGPVGTASYVSKLSSSLALTWARVIPGTNISQLATDGTGAVYAMGGFIGQVDLDPGPGTDLHDAPSSSDGGQFLLKLDTNGLFAWSATIEGVGSAKWTGLSTASDSSVWTVGKHSGGSVIRGQSLGDEQSIFVAGFEPGGPLRRLWSLGRASVFTLEPNLAAGAGVAVSGAFTGSMDFDPGSGTVERFSIPLAVSGFTAGLDATGAYRSAHTWRDRSSAALAMTPAGGLLVGFATSSVRAFYPDGVSAWTLPIGSVFTLSHLVASSTHFVAIGVERGKADFDPGPGTDPIANATLATRYAF